MKSSVRIIFLPLLVALALPAGVKGSMVFKPKEGVHFKAPGDEETSGTVQELFNRAQEAERRNDPKGAIKLYRSIYAHHSHDALAAGSVYRMAQLQEQTNNPLGAAQSYAVLVEKYPNSERFEQAIEAMFRIGEVYLNGQKQKILGVPVKSGAPQAAIIFTLIIRTAPYGKYTARAQFDLGRAREKENQNDAAIAAYQSVV